MTANPEAISTPKPFKAPRGLTRDEVATARRCADALVPQTTTAPSATADPEFDRALTVAVDARADAFDDIVAVLAQLRDVADQLAALRELSASKPDAFQAFSAVLAGAWLLTPSVRSRIGYPGQRRTPPPLSEAVDQLSDGLMDDVLERGSIYVATPDAATAGPTWAERHPDLAKEL